MESIARALDESHVSYQREPGEVADPRANPRLGRQPGPARSCLCESLAPPTLRFASFSLLSRHSPRDRNPRNVSLGFGAAECPIQDGQSGSVEYGGEPHLHAVGSCGAIGGYRLGRPQFAGSRIDPHQDITLSYENIKKYHWTLLYEKPRILLVAGRRHRTGEQRR